MRTKTLLISLLLVSAALLGACATPSTSQTTRPDTNTINVTGHAQTLATPDIAYISIGVHTENPDAKQAVSDNTAQAQKIMDALKAAGVDAKDLRTTNFAISPQTETGPNGETLGTKYVVDNTVYVTLRDLTKVGDILEAAVTAGANNINGIQFDVNDKTQLLSDLRKSAVTDARKQAEELAQAAGVTLGTVSTINYYNNYPVAALDLKSGVGGAGAAVTVPVTPGQLNITVDVNIIYNIR